MVYKVTDSKSSKKRWWITVVVFLSLLGGGLYYWNYKMNYEMLVTFDQMDANAYDYPVGKRKIDASPWIKQGYRKLTSYQIYNPNVKPLIADSYLFDFIKHQIKNYKDIYPKLYRKFNQEDALEIFLNNKEVKSQYLYSCFNNDTNQPTDDYFLLTFDGYQIEVQREFYIYEGHEGYLFWGVGIEKVSQPRK
jgi:hypothetical protein